jgi:hypothetical protein
MALTPGSYVPQGQVGTGAAYVHEIKDRSGYVEALAEAAKEQRVQQEKQMAKLKGFDYGKVVDPVMKQHISEQYKKGLTAFSEVVSKGGDISSITTPEGIAFSDWQNNIKNEADTAARAEAMKSQFQTTVANNVDDYDVDIVNAALSSYDNAQTPDQKLKAMVNFNPLYVRGFDYNKWINTQFDNAVKDVEVTDFGGDINKYQEVYNQKIDVLPEVLAVDPGYPIAELQWQRKKDKKEPGFQQDNFGQFLTEQIDYQRRLRESKRESPAAKGTTNNIYIPGADASKGTATVVPTVSTTALSVDVGKLANEGNLFFSEGDTDRDPYLEIKNGSGNPKDYGLSGDYAFENKKARGQGIMMKSSDLWKLESPHKNAVSFTAGDKYASAFKGKVFTDENGKPTTGNPSKIYEDQLGNVWLDLADENTKAMTHVILSAGGLSQKFSKGGKYYNHPFVGTSKQNQAALQEALGVNYDEFMNKYMPTEKDDISE